MGRRAAAGLLGLGLAALAFGADMSGPTQLLRPTAVTQGGGTSASTSHELTGVVGQAATFVPQSSGHQLLPGFARTFAHPSTVTDLSALTVTTTTIQLQLSAPGLTGSQGQLMAGSVFAVQYAASAAGPWTLDGAQLVVSTSGVTLGDILSMTLPGLTPNTTTYIRLWARDAVGGASEESNIVTAVTLSRPVGNPGNEVVSADSVRVFWDPLAVSPASHSAQGYRVEGSSTNFGALSPGGVVFSSTSYSVLTSSLVLSGLSQTVTYYFRVGSLNWADVPNYVSAGSGRTADTTAPDAAASFTAAPAGEGEAALSWSIPSGDPAGYDIRAATTSLASWLLLGGTTTSWLAAAQGVSPSAGGALSTHTATGLFPGVTWYFILRSSDAAGNVSPPDLAAGTTSQAAALVLDLPPATPTGFGAASSSAAITLSWIGLTSPQKGPDFDRYVLYRSTLPTTLFAVLGSTTGTTLVDSSPLATVTYYYRLSALDKGAPNELGLVLESALSGSISAILGGVSRPAQPVLSGTALSTTAVQWGWTYSGASVDNFELFPSTGPSSGPLFASDTYYLQTGLSANQLVVAYLKATNSGGSTDSNLAQRYTLANPPTSLSVASAAERSVELSWSANGNPIGTVYSLERSEVSTGPFVVLSTVPASPFTDATAAEGTTYFYRVGAKNGDGLPSPYEGPVSTATPSVPPGAINAMAVITNPAVGRRLELSWVNPTAPDLNGVMIVRSTVPVVASPQDGLRYSTGMALGNGVVVFYGPAVPAQASDVGLTNFTTYYYRIFARDGRPNYGPSAAGTGIPYPPKDLIRPQTVAGFEILQSTSVPDITLVWSPTEVNEDFSEMEDHVAYRIVRWPLPGGATDLAVVLPPGTTSFSDVPTGNVAYQIYAIDFSDNESPVGPIVTNEAKRRVFFAGDSSILQLGEAGEEQVILAENSPTGRDILLRLDRNKTLENPDGELIRVFNLHFVDAESGEDVPNVSVDQKSYRFIFSYGPSTSVPVGLIDAAAEAQYHNQPFIPDPWVHKVYFDAGLDLLDLGGRDDPATKTVSVSGTRLGVYKVMRGLRPSGFFFDPATVRPRVFTPNGDGKNDRVFFFFDNPNSATVRLKVFDVNGGEVKNVVDVGPTAGKSLYWDGTDGSGKKAPAGPYIYRMEAEDRVFMGTVVLAR